MAKTWKEMVAEAKQQVTLLSVDEAKRLIDSRKDVLVVDVREKDEYIRGHLRGALHIPRGVLEMTVDQTNPECDPRFRDPSTTIIVHCAAGGRSAMAALALKTMGFRNASSLEGGYNAWEKASYPVEK